MDVGHSDGVHVCIPAVPDRHLPSITPLTARVGRVEHRCSDTIPPALPVSAFGEGSASYSGSRTAPPRVALTRHGEGTAR